MPIKSAITGTSTIGNKSTVKSPVCIEHHFTRPKQTNSNIIPINNLAGCFIILHLLINIINVFVDMICNVSKDACLFSQNLTYNKYK